MKKIVPLLIAAFACSVPQLASAVPVRATFGGTISGTSAFSNVLNDFPVGTAASFDVTFDDSGLVDSASDVTDYDVGPVSGWLRLGALEWLFDAGRIYTFTYMNTPGFPVVSYGLQLTGAGPTISESASIFGLFLQLTPDSAPDAGRVPLAGFRYPFPGGGGEFYSYANLSGTFTTARETTSVSEPSTVLLMGSALVLLAFWRRKSVRSA